MNAVELFNASGSSTGVWVCGKCRKVSAGWWSTELGDLPRNTKEAAEACCTDPPCSVCGELTTGADNRSYRDIKCKKCRGEEWRQSRAERLFKQLEAAEDVTGNYDGPVYVENSTSGDMGEGYYSSVERLAEDIEEEDETAPEFAFCCKSRVESFDLGREIEQLCSEGYEDMADRLTVPQSLKDAVDEFNKVNEKALTVWDTDYKRKVRVR